MACEKTIFCRERKEERRRKKRWDEVYNVNYFLLRCLIKQLILSRTTQLIPYFRREHISVSIFTAKINCMLHPLFLMNDLQMYILIFIKAIVFFDKFQNGLKVAKQFVYFDFSRNERIVSRFLVYIQDDF